MNPNLPSPAPPGDGPLPTGTVPSSVRTLTPHWGRRFLARNPFFLVSAALLLFGINRLSIDPTFLGAEEPKLAFNFAALQLYEILVIFVAILLSLRKVWYDSTLLVVLENMFVLVPFILVTQAILIGKGLAAALCVVGTLFALARWDSLRRWIPELRLSRTLLGLGALILGLNLALPIIFRPIMDADVANWEKPGLIGWFVILPALGSLANLLPRPTEHSELPPTKSWLPLLIFTLWISGCAVHLWCVGYVAERPFHIVYLLPLAWVAAWTLDNRVTDLQQNPSADLRFALLHFPMAIPFLSIFYGNGHVAFALTLLNVLIYGALAISSRGKSPALQLLIICLAGLGACIPMEWGSWLVSDFDRAKAICMGLGVYVLIQSLQSKHPALGVCGAVVAGVSASLLSGKPLWNEGLEISCVFLLLHSFWWQENGVKHSAVLRFVTAATWCVHAIAWTHSDGTFARVTVPSAAVAILVVFFLVRRFRGQYPPLVLAFAAGVSLCATPINLFIALLENSPVGLLSLVASFALFGAGTILAYNKHRWHPTSATAREQRK